MISNFKRIARIAFRKVLGALLPELRNIEAIGSLQGVWDSEVSEYATIAPFCKVSNSSIEAYTYVSEGTILNRVDIGRYGSIGPYVIAGWGLHPTNGISTCPMFYSLLGQNGQSFSKGNNFEERRRITIGHDVFIGMKACILDGVKIGNGAVVAAGAVVNRDVPPYAVVGGVPAKILKYRFSPEVISRLLNLEWYLSPNPDGIHKIVAEYFYDPYGFFEALTVLEQENSCSGQ